MQQLIRKEALKLLRVMALSKTITATVKKALVVRLEHILENEEAMYRRWAETIKPKLNLTRQKQIEREFNKRIQALKIVINNLTPYFERTNEVPMFVVKKKNDHG